MLINEKFSGKMGQVKVFTGFKKIGKSDARHESFMKNAPDLGSTVINLHAGSITQVVTVLQSKFSKSRKSEVQTQTFAKL